MIEMMANPCSECVKTKNHCCVTDIVLNVPDAMLMMYHAKRLGKDVVLGWHINEKCNNELMMIPNKPNIDIRTEPCVFINVAGKCEIYEDRPSICRMFGTEELPCRFTYAGMKTEKEISAVTRKELLQLDTNALNESLSFFDDIKNFKEM